MVLSFVGNALMWTAGVLFAVKAVWNLLVPYAMINEALRHPDSKHGWSLFILLDIGLLLIALAGSALAGESASFSVATIARCGAICVPLSYLHLFVVLFLFGLARTSLNRIRERAPLKPPSASIEGSDGPTSADDTWKR